MYLALVLYTGHRTYSDPDRIAPVHHDTVGWDSDAGAGGRRRGPVLHPDVDLGWRWRRGRQRIRRERLSRHHYRLQNLHDLLREWGERGR